MLIRNYAVSRALHQVLQQGVLFFLICFYRFGPIKHGGKKGGEKITLLKAIRNYRKSPIENVEFFRYLPPDFGTCQRSDSETLNDVYRTSLKAVTSLWSVPYCVSKECPLFKSFSAKIIVEIQKADLLHITFAHKRRYFLWRFMRCYVQ